VLQSSLRGHAAYAQRLRTFTGEYIIGGGNVLFLADRRFNHRCFNLHFVLYYI
jgi:hypothetical protein